MAIRLLLIAALITCSATIAVAADAPSADKPLAEVGKLKAGETAVLFDGKSLDGWKISDFAGHGPVKVEDGQLVIEMGTVLTGVTWKGDFPKVDYEVTLEAQRVDGSDFFCGLTFPVEEDPCSLIIGGWGGGTVGLSSIDGFDASENETSSYHEFKTGKWYTIRLKVTAKKIQAWIDKEQVVDLDLENRGLSIRIEVEESRPFGISTYQTTAALRNLRIKKL